MMQEAMRFAPVAATGTTRVARQAMMLGGYFIPRWGAPAHGDFMHEDSQRGIFLLPPDLS